MSIRFIVWKRDIEHLYFIKWQIKGKEKLQQNYSQNDKRTEPCPWPQVTCTKNWWNLDVCFLDQWMDILHRALWWHWSHVSASCSHNVSTNVLTVTLIIHAPASYPKSTGFRSGLFAGHTRGLMNGVSHGQDICWKVAIFIPHVYLFFFLLPHLWWNKVVCIWRLLWGNLIGILSSAFAKES